MGYPAGSLGADLDGRHLRILDGFLEKQAAAEAGVLIGEEAMSVSDFPTYIGFFSRKTFLGTFEEVNGAWGQYTHDMPLEDFEEYTSFRWGRFPDIPQRPLNGPLEELAIREYPGPAIKLIEYAAAYAVTRQLILSDRLNRIAQLPVAFAEAMARTISKRAVSQLEGNPTMFDGNALISSAHVNIGSTALTVDTGGVNALIAALDAIDLQKDDEGYTIVQPGGSYVLIVPRALQWKAQALASRENVPFDATSGTSQLRVNEVAGRFSVVVEPFLTDTNNWYLALNPTGPQGFLASLTLNGNNTPYLGQKDDKKLGILGRGEDPYSFEFDELKYMVRHDYDFQPTEWRTVFGAIVT